MTEPREERQHHFCYVCQDYYLCGWCNNPKVRNRHCRPPENFHICSTKCLNDYINYYRIHKL